MNTPTKKLSRKGSPARTPRPGVPIPREKIVDLIPKTYGTVARIADALGCSRHTIHRLIKEDQELTDLLEDARERRYDELEDTMWHRAIKGQDTTLQLFLAKTKMKHRGYAQNDLSTAAQDIARAAIEFVWNKTKSPVDLIPDNPQISTK